MTPREAAERIVPDKEQCRSGTMLLAREEAIAEIEQIIQAACDEATRVRWTKEKPTQPGWYWWRSRAEEPVTIRQVREHGHTVKVLVVDYWKVSEQGGEWSDKPIKEPE